MSFKPPVRVVDSPLPPVADRVKINREMKKNWNGVSEFIQRNPQQAPQPVHAGGEEQGELGEGKGGHSQLCGPQAVNIDL